MNPEHKPCPNCQGKGYINQYITISAWKNPVTHLNEPIYFKPSCPMCYGRGYLKPSSKKGKAR